MKFQEVLVDCGCVLEDSGGRSLLNISGESSKKFQKISLNYSLKNSLRDYSENFYLGF